MMKIIESITETNYRMFESNWLAVAEWCGLIWVSANHKILLLINLLSLTISCTCFNSDHTINGKNKVIFFDWNSYFLNCLKNVILM